MKVIKVTSQVKKYSIYIETNLLDKLSDFFDINRFYVIISDSQIPKIHIKAVTDACKQSLLITFPAGEKSKSIEQYSRIISIMQQNNVPRDACIIALGGGVTGDLAGFIAATYLRGIDYIQIPTTLLSQIDSSVGGKVAINTDLAKNSIGNFYPPSKVLIDPSVLQTLPIRHFNNGMAEMIKYGMIHSESLFNTLAEKDVWSHIEELIYESLMIKKYYVENDEFDESIRRFLNFGHTYGHAYEAFYHYDKYLHGEAISLGMVKVCDNIETKKKLISVLKKFNLPIEDDATESQLIDYVKKDKKISQNYLSLITVDKIGEAYIKKVKM